MDHQQLLPDDDENHHLQQSFVFGAFPGQTRGIALDAAFDDDDDDIGDNNHDHLGYSYQLGCDVLHLRDPVPNLASSTDWKRVFVHLTMSIFLLPIYAIALVTHTWRYNPSYLTRGRGVAIILSAVVFYLLLWVDFGLVVGNSTVRSAFSPEQATFVFLLYVLCCFAESMLKNTRVADDPYGDQVRASLNRMFVETAPLAATGVVGKMSLGQLLERFEGYSTRDSVSRRRNLTLLAIVLALLYAAFIIGMRILLSPHDNGWNRAPSIIAYLTIDGLLQVALSFAIFYQLGEAVSRLTDRAKVATCFQSLTSRGKSASLQLPCIRLNTLPSIQAWQVLRATLLHEYRYPTLYVDVILSAAFLLWVPLVLIGVIDFLFRETVTALAANAVFLSVLLLLYLIVCVVMATNIRESFSNGTVLRAEELRMLYTNSTAAVADQNNVFLALQKSADLMERGKDDMIVFQIWGMPLNRRMTAVLGGALVTVASSVVTRFALATG